MLSHFARLAASIGHAWTRYLLVAGGLVIGLMLAAVMTWFVIELRQNAIADAARELRNDALMLAEEEDRLLQSVEVVQARPDRAHARDRHRLAGEIRAV